MTRKIHIVAILACASLAQVCAGQCNPRWWAFGQDRDSWAMTIWDVDGAGPGRAELISGIFERPVLGQAFKMQVRRYDGRTWRDIGEVLQGHTGSDAIRALEVAETSGIGSPMPGLYVAGKFQDTGGEPAENIVRWDGTRWRTFGDQITAAALYSLAMFDEDGAGPQEANLFVGGTIISISNGITRPGVVRWDGTSYTRLGSGSGLVGIAGTNATVTTMLVFDDDGVGPHESALYVGGSFDFVNGNFNRGPARWTGTNWEALGSGLGATNDMVVFDADGDGPEPPMLYAGGGYTARDPQGNEINNLGRWNGTNWERVPGWNGGGVIELGVFDPDGDGPASESLIVSGFFSSINGVPANFIARWDGETWWPMGSGLFGLFPPTATDMIVFDEDGDPSTPNGLYIAGRFSGAGGQTSLGFARWGCESPICFADCDESTGLGTLDLFDFLCFQNSFVTGDAYACNCDTSTGFLVCDLFDFLCFQSAFVGGCS